MKSRQPASAKRYRIVFGKAQAGIVALILLVGMAGSFGFGYLWGAGGASNKTSKTGVASAPEALEKDVEKKAERSAVVEQKKMPEPKKETPIKTADAIKPKFYQDLLKENQENEQPIELIKLPVVKKIIPPKPAPPTEAVAAEPPEKEKPLDRKAEAKEEKTNGIGDEPRKREKPGARTSKPWTRASGYTIQVVSVKKFDVALGVVRKLRNAGFQPFIKNADLGSRGKWYRVRVGHYRDKAEAQKALSDMRVRLKLLKAKIVTM